MNNSTEFYQTLEEFISYPSIEADKEGNKNSIELLKRILKETGFSVEIKYQDTLTYQPVIIAKLVTESVQKIVLYNHYDVEKIASLDDWNTSPFQLTEISERLYARGIADNKASLLARFFAVKTLLGCGTQLPNILWLIQGEEEVNSDLAEKVFPPYVQKFGADLYVEETGYNRDGRPIIFHSSQDSDMTLINDLNDCLFAGKAIVENRHLKKFGKCPFISSIPNHATYVGFGPNDYSANIHKENESISLSLLEGHIEKFQMFLIWVQRLSK